MEPISPSHQQLIRDLNDSFRTTGLGGKNIFTSLASVGNPIRQIRLLRQVRDFKDFDEANDPYDEHDFGAFELDGEKYFWRIDYYDKAMEYGSPDPSNPSVTTRVLTIMLAEEY